MARQLDVPRILFAVGRRYRPLVEAVGRDQAALRFEGVAKRRRRVDAFNPGVEHGRLWQLLCPERDEPPSPLAQSVAAIFAGGNERHVLRVSSIDSVPSRLGFPL